MMHPISDIEGSSDFL